jgi:hypothetical protein
MMTGHQSERWTGFLLSLAVPGSGQLLARHPSCVAWFAAAAGLMAGTAWLAAFSSTLAVLVNVAALLLLGLASAEHAKRCMEPHPSGDVKARVVCTSTAGPAVCIRITLEMTRPADEVWRAVADFPRFVCADPFHRRVVVLGKTLTPGVHLALEHCAFGITLWRFGKLLNWREGHGFAFSDLSARGPRHGFPHVFFVKVLQLDAERTCLQVTVRGKWTAPWVPHWLRRCWLTYVCREHARLLRPYLLPETA